MAKKITTAQMEAIRAANEAVKGTTEYSHYYMCYEYRTNGKWFFGGYGVPHTTEEKPIRTYGDKRYIMINDERRFTITPAVEEIINNN